MALIRSALENNEEAFTFANQQVLPRELIKTLNASDVRKLIQVIGYGPNHNIKDIDRVLWIEDGLPIDPWHQPYQLQIIASEQDQPADSVTQTKVAVASVGSGLRLTLPDKVE